MKKKMTRREDYLKLIYTLSKKGEVHGADLADELNVKRPTVCVYLKRLVDIGDIVMDEHHCVHLTQQGLQVAESTWISTDCFWNCCRIWVCPAKLLQKMPAPLSIISAPKPTVR